MQTTVVIIADIISIISASTLAQGNRIDGVRVENSSIWDNTRDIRVGLFEVGRDNSHIAPERRVVAHDKSVLSIRKYKPQHDRQSRDAPIVRGDVQYAPHLNRASA